MSSRRFSCRPIWGFVFVGCCSQGLTPLPPLKAVLRTRRMRNVMLDAKGNFETLFARRCKVLPDASGPTPADAEPDQEVFHLGRHVAAVTHLLDQDW